MLNSRTKSVLFLTATIAALLLVASGARIAVRLYELSKKPPLLQANFYKLTYEFEEALRLGANPNVQDERGVTPLFSAVGARNLSMANLLLSHNADPNLAANDGDIPIRYAAVQGNIAMVRTLRDHGARYTIVEAVLTDDVERIEAFLREDPALVNESVTRPRRPAIPILNLALSHRRHRAARLLVEHGADVNSPSRNGVTALMLAVSFSNVPEDLIDLMLGHDADLELHDDKDETLLHIAMYGCSTERVRKLIELGLDVNAKDIDGWTPLFHLMKASCKDTGIVDLLVEHGASIEQRGSDGETLLHVAATHSSGTMMEYLIRHGLDVNARDDWNQTPLAQERVWPFVVKVLVENGADVNAHDQNGNTPLHRAAQLPMRSSNVPLLIENGADLNARNHRGETPLHIAVRVRSRNSSAALLIQHGADVNAQDQNGDTPLHWATSGDTQHPAIPLLIKHGADIGVRNGDGLSPMDLASPEVLKLLHGEGLVRDE